mmetsp:Transcript_1972/g.2935  ORF Transcript_1972/g.2935 Transcript_1972/m.2935 type:complete len:152 (+) Transcript_1972:651-1106(+)
MIQDFSSSLPVLVLKNALKLDLPFKKYRNKNKDKKFLGIDSTSAPGNKTLQLAELCSKVYAFERDPKRFKVLSTRVQKANVLGEIECQNLDFIENQAHIEVGDNEELSFIVCDPSCSGSGMNLHQTQNIGCTVGLATPKEEKDRVEKLSKF